MRITDEWWGRSHSWSLTGLIYVCAGFAKTSSRMWHTTALGILVLMKLTKPDPRHVHAKQRRKVDISERSFPKNFRGFPLVQRFLKSWFGCNISLKCNFLFIYLLNNLCVKNPIISVPTCDLGEMRKSHAKCMSVGSPAFLRCFPIRTQMFSLGENKSGENLQIDATAGTTWANVAVSGRGLEEYK